MPTHRTALTTGQMADWMSAGTKALVLIANDLGPDLTYNWARNGEAMQRAILAALQTPETDGQFQIWKTIKLGTGFKNADDFRRAIKDAGGRISEWGDNILGKRAFTASDIEVEFDLVNVSVEELGFKGGATYKDICARAIQLGLQLCPAEVGPQLRLQYLDQPKDEWLRIAMEPIRHSDGILSLFSVAHVNDGLWLLGSGGDPDDFWNSYNRFVFCRRK